MDVKNERPLDGQPPEDKDGLLVIILVFMMRCAFVFICAVARSIVVVAGNRIPESLFDHPYITSFFTNLLPFNSRERRGHSRATQTTTNINTVPPPAFVPLPAQQAPTTQDTPKPVSASTYVVFVGREVGYTRKRQVIRIMTAF